MKENKVTKKTLGFFDLLEQEISYADVKEKAQEFSQKLSDAFQVANSRNWNIKEKKKGRK